MSLDKKKFIAFDTSCEVGMVVLFDQQNIYFSQILPEKYTHTKLLCPALEHALAFLKNNNYDLGAIFVGLGPGSFVGLRIALATALGFCWGRSVPLMGFCTLRALAHKSEGQVAIKASGDLCYYSSFNAGGDYIKAPELMPKNMLPAKLQENLTINLSAEGIQKACFYKLGSSKKIIDESAFIKPNYVKAPSVSLKNPAL